MKMKKIMSALMVAAVLASCSHRVSQNVEIPQPQTVSPRGTDIGYGPASAPPNATAFRMNGEYADNVAVTLGSDGELTYFPAPSDITSLSRPKSLGKGWWLNCQGISQNSVFTRYTFDEYSQLPTVPTPEQIKAAVIPGSAVTRMVQLPLSLEDARRNLTFMKRYISEITQVYRTPEYKRDKE